MLTEEQIIERILSGINVQHFDMLQNDEDETVALCIGQWEDEKPLTLDDPGCLLVHTFAERAGLPFFLIRCNADDSRRLVTPVNAKARAILPEPTTLLRSDWLAFAEKCIEAHA